MKRLSQWVMGHPVLVLMVVGIITAVLGSFAATLKLSTDLQELLPKDDPVVNSFIETSKRYGSQDFLLIAVHDETSIFTPGTLKKIWDLSEEFQSLPDTWVDDIRSIFSAEVVTGEENAIVVAPAAETLPQSAEDIQAFKERILGERLLSRLLISEDQRTTLIILEEQPAIINSDEAIKLTEAVAEIVGPYDGPQKIYLSGGPYILAQVRQAMIQDLRSLVPIATVILLAILFASFRQLRGVLLPVTVALVSVIWTLGLMAIIGFKLTIVAVIIPVILLAIADADSIHILTRYQEALHQYPKRKDALLHAMTRLGQPVIYTSISSAVGFLGLTTAYSVIIQEFAIATAVGIMLAMLLSFTLLPALLTLLPAKTSQHLARQPGKWFSRWQLGHTGKYWVRGAVVLFLISIVGIVQIKINNNPLDYVRSDLPVSRSAQFVEETFGGSLTLRISLDTEKADGWKDPEWLNKIQDLQNYMESLEHTGISTSIVDVVRELYKTTNADDPAFDIIPDTARKVSDVLLPVEFGGSLDLRTLTTANYREGQVTTIIRSLPLKYLDPLLDDVRAFLAKNFPDTPYRLSGQPMFGERVGETLVSSQVSSFMLSLFLVWVMLLILTRSVRLSLISVVPLMFAVTVMFGVMGFMGIALDIGTVMVASVAIGIGIDFAIHFISQYRQARQRLEPEPAIQEALDLTWRALLYNTLSLGLGFLVMLFSQFTANIAFGGLMGVTVIVAFVSTLRLVPALLLSTIKLEKFKVNALLKNLVAMLK